MIALTSRVIHRRVACRAQSFLSACGAEHLSGRRASIKLVLAQAHVAVIVLSERSSLVYNSMQQQRTTQASLDTLKEDLRARKLSSYEYSRATNYPPAVVSCKVLLGRLAWWRAGQQTCKGCMVGFICTLVE